MRNDAEFRLTCAVADHLRLSAEPGVLAKDVVDRFWPKVDKRGPDDCWPWIAALSDNGYGRLGGGIGRPVLYAHRVAFEAAIGPIPDGVYVCHRCDNRRCCNPAHLFLGTAADNTHDCIRKGRHKFPPKMDWAGYIAVNGRHPNQKVSDEDVQAIRRSLSEGKTLAAIAAAYGVSFQHVSKIKHGERRGGAR